MTRHLLHIGFPKAGSTFLQRWFAAHPQLAYAEGGIAGFHDVYAIARGAVEEQREPLYRVTSTEHLSMPSADAGSNVIDFERRMVTDTPAAQSKACRMLAELFPNAVVLIVTRGFRGMVLSSYSQFVRGGGFVDLPDLIEITRRDFDRIAAWHYDRIIAAYRDAFGADGVIVMPYELLRDDPDAFTTHLAQRLGIDPLGGESARVNESLSPAEMYWYPRFARVMRVFRWRKLYSLYVRASFANRLRWPIRWLAKVRPRGAVTEALINDDVLAPFRGRAESLRHDPLFAPYLRDYLM